jgi:NADPH:quinone reductase-like Zn-dependent oxidoreductase
MKAVVYTSKRSHHKFEFCEVETPVPKENEVLIRVHAASLNAADYRPMKLGIIPKSRIFGADVAGRIESVGKSVTLFQPGDDVMGDLARYGYGGLGEFVAVPEQAVIKKPERISFEDCAAVPLAAITALQALRDHGQIRAGQEVLIVGSAGGVGTFAVQLAKHFGGVVTGVCSAENLRQTSFLGADYVIDYKKESITTSNKKYDLVLGVNGKYSLATYIKVLKPKGKCVIVGGALLPVLTAFAFGWAFSVGSKKIKAAYTSPNQTVLKEISDLLDLGVLKPVIDRTYPLEQAGEAMDYISKGHASGKVVVKIIQNS